MLYHWDEFVHWQQQMQTFDEYPGFTLVKQINQFAKMGKQNIPVMIQIDNIESLARYLGQFQAWQGFLRSIEKITQELPGLASWLPGNARYIVEYMQVWDKLIRVCQYFLNHPNPNCYIRQLDIEGVDTKFIESHKRILKNLFDHLLPASAINANFDKLAEHGFEKRFGLLFDAPVIRFRVLDPLLADDLAGLTDLSLPIAQFAQLNLLIDKVFITENKISGLAFPPVNNAICVFGLGYGVQLLKEVSWLNQVAIYYWGDIDTHGFAILSQLRGYFPKVKSMLMDEATLLACKPVWGKEPESKVHAAQQLSNLTQAEHLLYSNLKTHYWQANLRLEQEQIPFHLLQSAV